ncbi:MAG: uncharacterized protein JWN03_6634 [Nocardia sp.]|nr:uncharacterized protein [Nocardia sp.]
MLTAPRSPLGEDRNPTVSKPNTRTIVALAAAALLVVAVAYVAVIVVLARHADKPQPQITAYAHGKSVSVTPYLYCDVHIEDNKLDLRNCDDSQHIAELTVPAGYPLQLSLPKEIADAPWQMVLVYQLPDGQGAQRLATHRDFPQDARAITVPTPTDPHLQLTGIELQLPIPARDENGQEGYVTSARWAIHTAA